jgi:beta-N-acetylhexosaminidase
MAANSSTDDVRALFADYGTRARALGITVVLGPVLDVGSGPGIESRSFGDDPAVVTAYGGAVAEGLREGGIMPVFKHFPGHGLATADSHLQLPTTAPLDELRIRDLIPYATLLVDPALHGDFGVMVAHLAVPGLSGDVPTSLSPEAITVLLRNELGFTGLVFTDALNMGAIVDTYGVLDAVELSIRAGADIAIVGGIADVDATIDHLVMLAEADPVFSGLVDNRALRILVSKGLDDACSGAQ